MFQPMCCVYKDHKQTDDKNCNYNPANYSLKNDPWMPWGCCVKVTKTTFIHIRAYCSSENVFFVALMSICFCHWPGLSVLALEHAAEADPSHHQVRSVWFSLQFSVFLVFEPCLKIRFIAQSHYWKKCWGETLRHYWLRYREFRI